MRTAQLTLPAVIMALAATAGCNRAQTQEQTQRAADEVKAVAARAGDSLADGWLTTRIQAQYFADDQVKGRYIDVSTRDKVVTLKGFVDSPAARERALQIARNTDGVQKVDDQLLIGQSPKAVESTQPVATSGTNQSQPGTPRIDDAQVTTNIQASFFLDPTVKARHIQVDTRDGVVTLSGEVASESERAQALVIARNSEGVQRVEDDLTVDATTEREPTTSAPPSTRLPSDDAVVAGTVKSRFASDPELKVVDVTVQQGVAQLQGTVASVSVRNRAVDIARQTEGVTQVVDRLRVKR
jgi:hyperosmotically inducible protein